MTILTTDELTNAVLGKGWASPLAMNDSAGDFASSEGTENLRNCIIDLLSTPVGERVMNEDVGNPAASLIFAPPQGVADVLPGRIKETLLRYEPRVAAVRVATRVDEATGDVNAEVSYVIRATGQPDKVSFIAPKGK